MHATTQTNLLEEAIRLARDLHRGQTDKGGGNYIEHPLRVMEKMRAEGEEAMMVAVLHDVVEDCRVTGDILRGRGFSAAVVGAVELLTKQPEDKGSDAGYAAFVDRIAESGCRIAVMVKLADLEDNLRLDRLDGEPNSEDLIRAERYKRAHQRLTEALAALKAQT